MPVGGLGAAAFVLTDTAVCRTFPSTIVPQRPPCPEGYASPEAGFAILHVKGTTSVTKLVEGPFPVLKIFDQGLQGQGHRRGGFEGFPRFEKCDFRGEYPFGEADSPTSPFHSRCPSSAGIPLSPWTTRTRGSPAPYSSTRFAILLLTPSIISSPIICLTSHRAARRMNARPQFRDPG